MKGIKSDRIICPEGIVSGYIYWDNGKIVSVSKDMRSDTEIYDYTGKYVSPGFIDIHTHGGAGHPFAGKDKDDVIAGCNFHLSHGTTTILPTISASPFEYMKESVIAISKAMNDNRLLPNVPGAHLEGPYLSAAQCGAQCPDFITPPDASDYEKLVTEYGKYIARWTYAPENDKDGIFCKYITSHGIIASCGHSDAKYEDIRTAIDNGCDLVTHLYSCTSTVTRDHGFRSLGVIESAFLRDDLFVEIIADGRHLPYDLIKMIIKIKGTDKVALITDSLEITGTDIKEGTMCGTNFIVEDGVCKLCDRSAFAGSIATSDRLVRVLHFDCGFDIPDAVKMITKVPANILDLKKGALIPEYDADIIVFDDAINVSDVFVRGNKIEI